MHCRWLSGKSAAAGLTVHSDRGSQYASKQYRQLLKIHSFIGSLKQEQIHWQHHLTRYAAQQEVLQYTSMFYHSQRLHSYLGYKNPNQYEAEIEKLKNMA